MPVRIFLCVSNFLSGGMNEQGETKSEKRGREAPLHTAVHWCKGDYRLQSGDHFEKGEREMANGTRTLAFQVSEEFFQRLKKYLKKTGQSQKEFVIGLIEDVLSQEEHVVSGEMQETEGKAELEETE